MKAIHPNLFTQVMQFPANVRADMLEFLGATPVEDAQVKIMIDDVSRRLRDGGPQDDAVLRHS